MSEERIAIAAIQERIGAIAASVAASHTRQDRLEVLLREEIKEMTKVVKELADEFKKEREKQNQEIKDLTGWMNRGKGWAAAALFLSAFVGGLVAKLFH